jgi:hypothetical protein
MNRFRDKLAHWRYQMSLRMANFLQGRYGFDALYRFLMYFLLALTIANWFLRSPVLTVLEYAVLIWAVTRSLSRRGAARSRENAVYLRLTGRVRSFFKLQRLRITQHKTARFRRCPHCHKILRLPKTRGRHVVHCPNCGQDFTTRILL